MVRDFDLIVFDWDGTLLDSPAAIVHAIVSACMDLGIAPPDESLARKVIGLGLADALGMALPELPAVDYPRLAQRYRHHYMAADERLSLYEGVREMLDGLKSRDYLLAVATGKTRVGLTRALEHADLGRYFDATRCADECVPKPHPAMLVELMQQLGTTAARTIMVGDTTHDLRMAANAGVSSVGVSYGAHQREELLTLEPLACVDSVAALTQWFASRS